MMRRLFGASLCVGAQHRFQGSSSAAPIGGGNRPGQRPPAPTKFNEPQLILRLLQCFPSEKTWVPIGKWSVTFPEEVNEALVQYGGLTRFAASQQNFFNLRKENGINFVSLSPMALELLNEQNSKIKLEEKRLKQASKRNRRSDKF